MNVTQCVYCQRLLNEDEVSFDHVVPLVRGGPDRRWNLAPCCGQCNSDKGCLTASEYLAVRDDPEDLEALKRTILGNVEAHAIDLDALRSRQAKAQAKRRAKQQQHPNPRTLADHLAAVIRGGGCVADDGFKCSCKRCAKSEVDRLRDDAAARLRIQLAVNAEQERRRGLQYAAEERRRLAKLEGRRAGE